MRKPTPVVREKRKEELLPSIKVDVLKSSGRVRLTIEGLVVEIGVIE